VAPGGQVAAANARKGYLLASGTSYAAPFVTATVALIRQRFPKLSPAQVQRLLKQTSDPAPGGQDSNTYGHGVLNPRRALTESIQDDATPRPASPLPSPDPAIAVAKRREQHSWSAGLVYAAIGVGTTILVVAAMIIIPRGRRRGWRPADS
jgi:membrane-anchored mycosin MYCP